MTDREIIARLRTIQAERVAARAAEQRRTEQQRALIARLSPYVRAVDLARALEISHQRGRELLSRATPSDD